MKSFKLVLLLSFFLYSLVGFSKTIIVTDIDDTIKKANTMGGIGGIYHFLKKRPYEYARDLYNEINQYEKAQGEETLFYYVSAAPEFVFDAPAWFKLNKFPIGPTFLKTRQNGGETYAYKYRTIKTIIEKELEQDPDLKVIFFGDNSQHDAQVYYDLKKDMNLLNSLIYIRDVSTEATDFDPELPVVKLPGVIYFFSEMELTREATLFFMSRSLIDGITRGYDSRSIIPPYTFDTLVDRLKEICQKNVVEMNEEALSRCKTQAKAEAYSHWQNYFKRF